MRNGNISQGGLLHLLLPYNYSVVQLAAEVIGYKCRLSADCKSIETWLIHAYT